MPDGSPHEPTTLPSVAVLIPARNPGPGIRAALQSVVDQAYDGPLGVIIADGGGASEQLVDFVMPANRTLKIIDNPGQTAPSGLNAAIRTTTADVLVRCDAHSTLPERYVARAVETLMKTGAANVGGMQVPVSDTPKSRAIAYALTSSFGVGGVRYRVGGAAGDVDTVYLGCYDRRPLEDVGLFDEAMIRNQDYELNYRLRKAGYRVFFDPELSVAYRPRQDLRSLWRQYFDYGRGKRAMLRKHPRATRPRQLAPIALVVGLLASGLLLITPLWRWAGIIPMLYAVGVCVVATTAAVRRKDSAMLRIVGVLPTMHLAWGSGFVLGRRLGSE